MPLTDDEEHKATGSNLTYQDRLHPLRHLSVQIISKAKIGAVEAVAVAGGAKFTFFFSQNAQIFAFFAKNTPFFGNNVLYSFI